MAKRGEIWKSDKASPAFCLLALIIDKLLDNFALYIKVEEDIFTINVIMNIETNF